MKAIYLVANVSGGGLIKAVDIDSGDQKWKTTFEKKSSSSASVEANQDILDQCNFYVRDSAISRRATVLHYSNMTLMTNKIKEYFCSLRGQCLSSR